MCIYCGTLSSRRKLSINQKTKIEVEKKQKENAEAEIYETK